MVLRVRLVWTVFMSILFLTVNRGSSVGGATRYGWTVRESNPGWCDIFSIRPDRPWGPPNRYWVFSGDKATGKWLWPPTPSSAEVKERVEPYIYSHSGPLWPVSRWTLSLLISTFNLKSEWSQDTSSHIEYVLSRVKLPFIVLVSVITYSCAKK